MTCKCKDCESRTLGCHDNCQAYAEYKAYREELKRQDKAKRILPTLTPSAERKMQKYKQRYRRENG